MLIEIGPLSDVNLRKNFCISVNIFLESLRLLVFSPFFHPGHPQYIPRCQAELIARDPHHITRRQSLVGDQAIYVGSIFTSLVGVESEDVSFCYQHPLSRLPLGSTGSITFEYCLGIDFIMLWQKGLHALRYSVGHMNCVNWMNCVMSWISAA